MLLSHLVHVAGRCTGAAIYTGRRLSIFPAEKKVILYELFDADRSLTRALAILSIALFLFRIRGFHRGDVFNETTW